VTHVAYQIESRALVEIASDTAAALRDAHDAMSSPKTSTQVHMRPLHPFTWCFIAWTRRTSVHALTAPV